jgi:hypothetical protein
MARSTTDRVAAHQARYHELAERIAEIGFIRAGSITRVHNRCGKPNCRCHADPPQLHGPYWQWTAKINGKTVTRRLNETQAGLYQQWIGEPPVSRTPAPIRRGGSRMEGSYAGETCAVFAGV